MAWTTPKTWAADELLTASDLNQYLSDNLSALYALTQGGGRKNLLHNGAMQVHQRGTSVTGITSTTAYSGGTWTGGAGYFTADRWSFAPGTLGTWTQSVEADAPTGSGFRKSLKVLITANADTAPVDAGDYAYIQASIEGQNAQTIKKGTTSAEQVTLSFWVKSNKTGTYVVEVADADNTRHVAATYTIDSSATWEQQTITFPADLSGALDNDNAYSLGVLWWLAAGSTYNSGTLPSVWAAKSDANRAVGQTNLAETNNNYLQITGVQLEVGSAATGYEFKNYEQELAECQRYYQHMNYGASDKFYPFAGDAYSTTILEAIYLPVTNFRTTPTAVTYSNLGLIDRYGSGVIAVTDVAIGQAGQYALLIAFTVASGLTAGTSYWVQTGSSSASHLGISADL